MYYPIVRHRINKGKKGQDGQDMNFCFAHHSPECQGLLGDNACYFMDLLRFSINVFNAMKTLGWASHQCPPPCLAASQTGGSISKTNPKIILRSSSFMHDMSTFRDVLDRPMAEPKDEVDSSFVNNFASTEKAYYYSFKT